MTDEKTAIHVGSSDKAAATETYRDGTLIVHTPRGLRDQEALLVETLPEKKSGVFLVIGARDGVLAMALSRLNPDAKIVDYHVDVFHQGRASRHVEQALDVKDRIAVTAHEDLPGGPESYAGIFIAHSIHEDSALTAEWIGLAASRLAKKGILTVAVDSLRDRLMRERVKRVFGAATVKEDDDRRGIVIIARRPEKARAEKPPHIETFTFKESGDVLEFQSRSGVFAAGRMDDGARALIREMVPRDGDRILDVGCGLGVVGICAARRVQARSLTLVDANVRALRLAEANASRILAGRGTALTALLSAYPERDVAPGAFDLVLANPPYFSDFRIAELFIDAGVRAVAPGGRFHLVTKQPVWYREELPRRWSSIREVERGGYVVFSGKAP